jgi:hypothetical protein
VRFRRRRGGQSRRSRPECEGPRLPAVLLPQSDDALAAHVLVLLDQFFGCEGCRLLLALPNAHGASRCLPVTIHGGTGMPVSSVHNLVTSPLSHPNHLIGNELPATIRADAGTVAGICQGMSWPSGKLAVWSNQQLTSRPLRLPQRLVR